MTDDVPLIEHWYAALNAEYGIKLTIIEGTQEQLRTKLYAERKRINDPELSGLTVVVNQNTPGEVWICHTDKLSGTDETA